jgi:8-oxo-dGTP pyrophosphatase MutT (NUDIX family)
VVVEPAGPDHGFRHLDDRPVHQGYIWSVAVGRFVAPDGTQFARDIVRSPGAVGVIPLHERGGERYVTLVRQYRPALDAELWEIPAGMRDVAGEPPEVTARRELAEEAGFTAGSLELLTMVHPSAGMTDATTHIYLARELVEVGDDRHGPEEAEMVAAQWRLADAIAAIERGELTDGKTVIGLLLASRRIG